jgi:hypothetical protein
MEETPEETLARLQHYVDSLNAHAQATPASAARSAPPLPHSFGILSRTLAGQAICVATCIVTILLWINVSRTIAYIVVAAAAVSLAIGLIRRFPFVGWALIGLALGLTLGAFS